jgi:amino acid adenylation domain-containing protein
MNKHFTQPDTTLLTLLALRAQQQPQLPAFTYLDGQHHSTLSYLQLHQSVQALALKLASLVQVGEPVVLLCPPGLEYIRLFYASLAAGCIAVPLYPPRLKQRSDRIRKVMESCGAKVALTTDELYRPLQDYLAESDDLLGGQLYSLSMLLEQPSATQLSKLVATDAAFIQYTSGSTGAPKGVVVGHDNILANLKALQDVTGCHADDVFVNWLPLFHDLGLVNTVLLPVYLGCHSVIMNPSAFVQQPIRWLKAISDFSGTICGAPNFAFDLCSSKISAQELATVDLTSWRLAFNAAEPIHADTLSRFSAHFAVAGFKPQAFYPSYGMAEATVFLCGGVATDPVVVSHFDKASLGQRKVVPLHCDPESASDGQPLVGCGAIPPDHQLLIVDPDTLQPLASDQIGEIWVCGPSIAKGYWGLAERTADTFQAFTATGLGPFLRTGDLGFVYQQQLYLSGRIKDLMIVRGRNYYPQDIEVLVNRSHPDFVASNTVAFALEDPSEAQVFVVQEVKASAIKRLALDVIAAQVRHLISREFDLKIHVLFIRQGTLPKTSSGKVQRAQTKIQFMQQSLELIEYAPHPEGATEDGAVTSPATATETVLWQVWQEVLRQAPGSRDADFFAAGADSLDATRFLANIETRFALQMPLEMLYEFPTIAALGEFIDQRRSEDPQMPCQRQIIPCQLAEAPLSFAQKRLWFIQQIPSQRKVLNLPVAIQIKGDLCIQSLTAALNRVIQRHAIFRTLYRWQDHDVLQFVQPYTPLQLSLELLTGKHSTPDDELNAILREETQQEFDLEVGPVFRLRLLQRAAADFVLCVTVHHIAADGWSLGVFLNELSQFYNDFKASSAFNRTPTLEVDENDTAISYLDFAVWQQQPCSETRKAELHQYWTQQLKDTPELLVLPYDRPRPARQSFEGSKINESIPMPVLEKLQQLSLQRKTTLFVTLLSAFQLLLQRWSGQTDIVIGTDVANRHHPQLSQLVGFFVNQLVLRQTIVPEENFVQLVERNRSMVLGALAHQDMAFEQLVDSLTVVRDPAFTPLFQVKFLLNQSPLHQFALSDVALEILDLPEQRSQYDLTLSIDSNRQQGFDANLHFNTDLFDPQTIHLMLQDYQVLLAELAAAPLQPLKQFNLASTQNPSFILAQQGPTRQWSAPVNIGAEFAKHVAATPDKVALVDGSSELTYRQLSVRVNQLCHFLSDIDITEGSVVGVHMKRSAQQVIALLAISKRAASFVPLDPEYPASRISFILTDSAPDLVLTDDLGHEHLAAYSGACMELDAELSILSGEVDTPLEASCSANDLAYRLYTSGSTGQPKGVNVTLGSLHNLCQWYAAFADIDQTSVVLQPISLSFDASIKNIFVPLMKGATLVLAPVGRFEPAQFNQCIRDHQVTVINCVPSMFYALVEQAKSEHYQAISTLRLVALGGEPTDLERLKPWLSAPLCQAQLANIYGPTECTDISVAAKYSAAQALTLSQLPIGAPIDNMNAYLVNPDLTLAQAHAVGELVISGAGVSQGYHQRPDLNSRHFLPNLFDPSSSLMYRTGDLMRRSGTGQLEYLGRLDDQIKINGMRVEAGEVEAQISAISGIRQCCVMQHSGRLVAFYQVIGLTPPTAQQLRQQLANQLPQAWIPRAFVPLREMPLLPNGKLDKKALLALDIPEFAEQRTIQAPQTTEQHLLCHLFAKGLNLQQVGLDENFFELGGDSINAVRVVSLANEAGLKLSVADIFENQTVLQLSQRLELTLQQPERSAKADAAFDMMSDADLALLADMQ